VSFIVVLSYSGAAACAGVYFGVRIANGFSAHGMHMFLGVVIALVGALTVGKFLW